MKGPYERLKYDLRRLWECPVCNRRERTAGSVSYRHCSCQMKQLDGRPVVMKLIADAVQRLAPAVRIEHPPLAASHLSEAAAQDVPPAAEPASALESTSDKPGDSSS